MVMLGTIGKSEIETQEAFAVGGNTNSQVDLLSPQFGIALNKKGLNEDEVAILKGVFYKAYLTYKETKLVELVTDVKPDLQKYIKQNSSAIDFENALILRAQKLLANAISDLIINNSDLLLENPTANLEQLRYDGYVSDGVLTLSFIAIRITSTLSIYIKSYVNNLERINQKEERINEIHDKWGWLDGVRAGLRADNHLLPKSIEENVILYYIKRLENIKLAEELNISDKTGERGNLYEDLNKDFSLGYTNANSYKNKVNRASKSLREKFLVTKGGEYIWSSEFYQLGPVTKKFIYEVLKLTAIEEHLPDIDVNLEVAEA